MTSPNVLLLHKTGTDERIWGRFGESLRESVNVVTIDRSDTGLSTLFETTRTAAAAPGDFDEFSRLIGQVDVIVANGDAARPAVEIALRRDVSGLVLMLPRPDAGPFEGVKIDPLRDIPRFVLTMIRLAPVTAEIVKGGERDPAKLARATTTSMRGFYAKYLDPAQRQLVATVYSDNLPGALSVGKRFGADHPWVERIRDVNAPVRIAMSSHNRGFEQRYSDLAASAPHGRLIELDAHTDLPWLEDTTRSVHAVCDLMPRN